MDFVWIESVKLAQTELIHLYPTFNIDDDDFDKRLIEKARMYEKILIPNE